MTRSNDSLLRRAYEQFTSSAAALAVTAVFLFSVNAAAAANAIAAQNVTPSVTILVPTVTIEVVE